MKMTHKLTILAALLLTITSGACADMISVSGTVTADTSTEVYAPIGGQIASVHVKKGQNVSEGDVLMTLRTSKVYAETDGTIRGIFGQPGDLVNNVTSRYNAVMFIETDALYTCSASTEYAYSATETKTIHIGENVYLKSTTKNTRTGTGIVKAVSGTKFEVEVKTGEFLTGEKAYVFRDAEMTRTQKIGMGQVTRNSSVSVTASSVSGTGSTSSGAGSSSYSIASIAVKDGQHVSRGDLLMELLTGSFDGMYMSGADILSDCTGTVASVGATQGATITKNAVAATVYTRDSMVIEAEIPEENLKDISEGDAVHIKLSTDETHEFDGVVRMISGVASENTGSGVTFTAWIDFTPDDAVRYGSTVYVETAE